MSAFRWQRIPIGLARGFWRAKVNLVELGELYAATPPCDAGPTGTVVTGLVLCAEQDHSYVWLVEVCALARINVDRSELRGDLLSMRVTGQDTNGRSQLTPAGFEPPSIDHGWWWGANGLYPAVTQDSPVRQAIPLGTVVDGVVLTGGPYGRYLGLPVVGTVGLLDSIDADHPVRTVTEWPQVGVHVRAVVGCWTVALGGPAKGLTRLRLTIKSYDFAAVGADPDQPSRDQQALRIAELYQPAWRPEVRQAAPPDTRVRGRVVACGPHGCYVQLDTLDAVGFLPGHRELCHGVDIDALVDSYTVPYHYLRLRA